MGNAFKFLKKTINSIPPTVDYKSVGRRRILDEVDRFIEERINLPCKLIAEKATEKITDGDVILTYGMSEVIFRVFCHANKVNKTNFQIIIVDSRPLMEGRKMLSRMTTTCPDVPCSYVLLSGLSYVMKEVTKVFMGAAALLRNGSVLSRVGSAGGEFHSVSARLDEDERNIYEPPPTT